MIWKLCMRGYPRVTRPNTPDQFWAQSEPEPNTGCWLWLGQKSWNGYGRFWWSGKQKMAHRLAYELTFGPIPSETLDHLCKNKGCVNPKHLEPVSNRENTLRGNNMAARHARQTHCLRGHPLDSARIERGKSGLVRRCRVCERERTRV